MKAFKNIGIGFVLGFLFYGVLDRILTAVDERNFRSHRNASQLALNGFYDASTEDLKSLLASGQYAYLEWSQDSRDGFDAKGVTYPIAYDSSIESHSGKGINILLSTGKIIWDQHGNWLRLFLSNNHHVVTSNTPPLNPIYPWDY